jgi:CheY-like chemotaxis protein
VVTKTVLIVDDDAPSVRLFRILLEEAGLSVVEAYNGLEALRLACEHKPDLIIADIRLPLVSGLEVIRQIRAHPTLGHTPIFVVTAIANSERKKLCEDLGCDAYFTKPVSVRAFLQAVQECFAREHLQRRLG